MAKRVAFGPGSKPPRGKLGKPAPSSTKQPKARGIEPGNPSWGISSSSGSADRLRKKADSIFGISRNAPSGQRRLSSKAKRQVQ